MIKVQYEGANGHEVCFDDTKLIFNHKDIKEVPASVGQFLLHRYPENFQSANLKGKLFRLIKDKIKGGSDGIQEPKEEEKIQKNKVTKKKITRKKRG